MQPEVSYIPHATSYHEKTGDLITFAQSKEGDLVENKLNTEEEESILASIDELYTYDDYDGGHVSTKYLKEIWDRSQMNPEIKTRDAQFKIHDRIIQTQN